MLQLTQHTKLCLLIITLALSACSSRYDKSLGNNYFHQQESFNIALISLHKISILGLIDTTQSLTPKEKQKYTELIFNAFAHHVDAENLIATENFAKKIGITNYQNLVHAAKQNNITDISAIMDQASEANRYVLISYLTNKTDYGNQGAWQDCSTYGYAVGLTLKIVDKQTNTLVWDGHLDKHNKVNACDNDDDFSLHPRHKNDDDDVNEAKAFLAIALITLAVTAIVDENNSANLAANDFSAVFSQTVNDLAQKLPSFYH